MADVNPRNVKSVCGISFTGSAGCTSSISPDCGFHFIRVKMEGFLYFPVSESLPERRPAEA
jgi:hypothetical protein